MSRGKRYEGDQQLNLKKVFAVVAVIIVIVLFVIGIKKILKADKNTVESKNVELNYFTMVTNGNWGVINSSGETILEAANKEIIQIPNKAKAVFITTETNYSDGTSTTKVVNENNQEIFTGYESVSTLQNYDENNTLWIEENLLKVQKDGKYGLINLDGKEVLPCEYDSIETLKGIKNSIIIKKEKSSGLVNSKGEIVVPVEYKTISAVNEDYKNGYIVENAESKFGIINSDGKNVLEIKYEKIENIIDNNKYIVKIDGTWEVISEDGKTYLDGKVSNVTDMNNGNVIIIENGKYGVISLGEEQKIPAEYDNLVYAFDNKYIAQKGGKYGVISINNETLIDFKYSEILHNKSTEYLKAKNENDTYDYISKTLVTKFTLSDANETFIKDKYISVNVKGETKYYDYQLEEKSNKDIYTANTLFVYQENGKYGYKNKDGKVIVEAKYDDAKEQNDYGFVAVKKDGKWGALDQYGKIVSETKYDLENNESIDFIGKWHIGFSNGAVYYTDAE